MPLGHVPHQVAVHLGWAGHQQAAPGCGEGRLGILGAEPGDPDPGANTLDRYQTGASADPGIQHINVPDRCPRRVAMVTHLDIPAPPIVTTTDVAAPLCTPATPSWTCILAKPLPWPKGGRSSPLSVTGVGTLRSGQMHAERLRAARRYLRCVHEGVLPVRLWPPAGAAAVILARTLGLLR